MTMLRAVDEFDASRERFEELVGFLRHEADDLTHGELERELAGRGRELIRQLYQDRLDLGALREQRVTDLRDADGNPRGSAEWGHERRLATIFGPVVHSRIAYRSKGLGNLHPADAALNLPRETHSHGLREMAARECIRGSFQQATGVLRERTANRIGKRQVEQLVRAAAVDVTAFYESRPRVQVAATDVLVLSADGKGIVMHPDSLRAQTRAQAEASSHKLKTRLSQGEKANRKRMAEVGVVHDATPVPRTTADVLATREDSAERAPAPRAVNKWLTASVADSTGEVIERIFDEAERRDPDHKRRWIALVDGNEHQIRCIRDQAKQRGVQITIIVDLIHVLEYLWSAAWSFHTHADPAAETWVHTQASAVLDGRARTVATTLRALATRRKLNTTQRTNVDKCARYLTKLAQHLDYPTALQSGWPIATGIIEGACRHIVKDRMDLTGARWGLHSAEAVLTLRALTANGDFPDYWNYHLEQEHQRVHQSRYAQPCTAA